jgi:nitrogenase molybdenum-iron protein NifN
MISSDFKPAPHEATRNACRLCAPLGASLAFAGIAKTLPYLHGGQGCATYIRRYTISHFREPIDIASSSFSEAATVFGGKNNLLTGLNNVIKQYNPDMIGIASTCLSETIGEDISADIREFRQHSGTGLPEIIFASTPSFIGSHYDGFQRAVYAVTTALAREGLKGRGINILPGMISPADIRYLYDICADFGLEVTILPDYSETLDGASWSEYSRLPKGGTPLANIRNMGQASATIELNRFLEPQVSAGVFLKDAFSVPVHRIGIPVGVTASDEFFGLLERYSGRTTPEKHLKERGRLLDSYVDAHKYVFGKKALVYGDPEFVVSIGSFLAETGLIPLLCASGKELDLANQARPYLQKAPEFAIYENLDFVSIEEISAKLNPDILIGSSKGYPLSRSRHIPLIRLNFPVHDRIGASRLGCIGYKGTQELFDRIVNSFLERQQDGSPIGHAYM